MSYKYGDDELVVSNHIHHNNETFKNVYSIDLETRRSLLKYMVIRIKREI